MKSHTRYLILLVIIPLLFSCKPEKVYLSDLKHGFIANEFGPPKKDLSYDKHKLNLRGVTYEKGLGVVAPSKIHLELNELGIKFHAIAGLDDETEKPAEQQDLTNLSDLRSRGIARFNVLGDDKILYSTGWLSHSSPPHLIDVNIKGIQKLTLEVEKSYEESNADHADWAEAWITAKYSESDSLPTLYSGLSDLLLNQTGFLPGSFKTFRTSEFSGQKDFSIIDISTNEVAFTGTVSEKSGDWGRVYVGDFSKVNTPGKYYIRYGERASIPFSVNNLQYVYNLSKHMNWFLWQRCGDPEHGWERGQHRDDGVRLDNMRHQDVSGGWHDAADLRKWGMTINGLWALSEVYLSMSNDKVPEFGGKKEFLAQIKDEFNWGNKHYTAMQEPAGYLMDQVGGDVYKHGDNNRFTDNIPGTSDDRWIVTTPRAPVFQYMFVIAQCNMALTDKPELISSYLSKALKCFRWATDNKIVNDIHSLGAAATASMKLYECTGQEIYLTMAMDNMKTILSRQDTTHRPVYGYIRSWKPGQAETENDFYPEENLSYNLITPYFPLWSIVEAIRVIKEPDLNAGAKNAFKLYFDNYIKYFDKISSYGNVPMALYRQDPGGNRKVGNYYYRWCYENHEDKEWWNGINPMLGYAGAILVRGGLLTGNEEAKRIGQQQLDFIYGCNPFNSSTVTGLGYNQPEFFKTSEYVPYTPETIGAVMAGIGSSEDDQPVLLPGWWQTTEYWMEAVTGTMMLLNELNNDQFEKQIKD